MGSNQSAQILEDEEEEENEDDDEEEEDDENGGVSRQLVVDVNGVNKKLLEQEPEMLPCYASASPLSPQLSSLGTPRMGPSIKVWDPYNVLAPPPPLPPPPASFGRSYSSDGMVVGSEERGNVIMEVYLISHGESELSLRPDLINGSCSDVGLTSNGQRQARALAVFLNSQGVRFNAVYSSPLDRAKSTALSVCQEMGFPEEQIQTADAVREMSQGHWEGCPRSEMYTPEILGLIDKLQPDFSAPSGESLRQVEFRMIQFLNGSLLVLPEKLRSDFFSPRPTDGGFSQQNSHIHDRDGPSYPAPHLDLLQRHRQLSRKKSGKSRLQVVTTTGVHYHEDDMSPKEPPSCRSSISEPNTRSFSSGSTCIGVFTHSVPIKCLLTGILGCSPAISHKLCVDDSSVTVLQHSWKTGWQIKRLNDVAHLRLL
uniref:Putative fructose-2,6-bisphosphatase n=3 Tax=Silene latifolia TaxID=37657 RepID=Q8VWN2_SILLA|nr:putative fructose-2,6-bisphosphatase [Silene latifolia]